MRLLLAVGQTAVTITQWYGVFTWAQMEQRYPPIVFATAHAQKPRGMMPIAIFMTVLAALLWFRAIRSAEIDEWLECR